jgi:class 3 adenylate cyclase
VADDDLARVLELARSLGATEDDLAEVDDEGGWGTLCMDLVTRPPGPMVAFEDACTSLGVPLGEAARMWRGLGFPDPLTTPTRLTTHEVATLGFLFAVSRDLLGPDVAAELARVVGASMSRLADAVVDALRISFEVPLLQEQPYSEVVRQYVDVARLFPAMTETIGAVLRRHIVKVGYELWWTDEERSAVTVDRTVGFADLVGYTETSQSLSTADLAAVVNEFERRVAEVMSRGGRLVKLIGDEAMFVVEDARLACELALELSAQFDADPALPQLRIGLAAGAVAVMRGDYYGDVVNLAARLVAMAEPSTVVVSRQVKKRLGDDDAVEPAGPFTLKGFAEPVPAFVLRPR